MLTQCFSGIGGRMDRLILQQLQAALGHLRPRRIVLKPNWVLHESDPAFPIRALVTNPALIEATAQACLKLFPEAEAILVGDCPLQSADWPLMCVQSGLEPVMNRLSKASAGKVQFRDLRKDVFKRAEGTFLVRGQSEHGDPAGYREVEIGKASHLEPISHQASRFGVNDYSAAVTASNHAQGSHRYFVCQSVLESDLFINLPKWKSHQKSGITCALKNVVGINGDKAYLPHFRRGAPRWGGDEYRDEGRWLYWLQTTLRERVQKRSRLAYQALKPGWELIKKVRGIETRMERAEQQPKRYYVAGGAWPGNDTIWRMIYDLNLIIQCADAEGILREQPQRTYYCIVDGVVSGEGNGPLEPLPRETDCLIFGDDPFAIDCVLSWCMGFNWQKIPLLQRRANYLGPDWGDFEFEHLEAQFNGVRKKVCEEETNFHFLAPPGWRGEIER